MNMKYFLIFLLVGVLHCVVYVDLGSLVDADQNVNNYFPILTKMLIFMIKQCDFKPGTLVINYDEDNLIQSLWDKEIIEFPLIQWTSKFSSPRKRVEKEIGGIIVNLNSTMDDFKKILNVYKNSPWWNVMVPFFIVYKVVSGCKDASRYLKTTSKINLIMTYFLCLNKDLQPTVYIFNPYSDVALSYWTAVVSSIKQYDKWTSFYRVHTNEFDFCSDLFFDRTENLDGALLKITMPFSFNPDHEVALEPGKTYNESILYLPLFPQMASMATAIMRNMNLSLEIVFENLPLNVAIDPAKLFRRLDKGTADLSLYPTSPTIGDKLSVTNPSMFSAYYIIAARTGQQSILEKIIRFYSMWIFILTFIVVLIVIATLMKATQKNLSYAVLEILRLFIGASLITPLVKPSMRIFFSVILIYFLILQAIFLGRFKTFLTSVVQRDNVERIEDLKENYIKSFATTVSSSSLIQNDQLKHKHIVTDDAFECIQYVIDGKTSACIEDYMFVLEPSLEHDLHLSKSPISYNYYTYVTREDWPLKHRLDKLLSHVREAGLSELWTEQLTEDFVIRAKRKAARSSVYVKPLTLNSLVFAFQILLIGLAFSSLCFIFEVWIGKEKNQIVNPSKPIHKIITHKNLRDFILNKKTKKFIVNKKIKEIVAHEGRKKILVSKNTKKHVSQNKIKAIMTIEQITSERTRMKMDGVKHSARIILKLAKKNE